MQIYNKKIFHYIIIFFSNLTQYIIINIIQILLSLSFFISIFFYFLLPLKHNIHIIYKLIYIIINILEHINKNIIKITSKKIPDAIYTIFQENILILNIQQKTHQIIIGTTMNNFTEILTLFKFLTKYHFVIYFTKSIQSSSLQKKFINSFYNLQAAEYYHKIRTPIKVLVYNTQEEIEQSKLFKTSSFFILNHKKNFSALFYS